MKLDPEQYRKEMQFIHAQGIRNILMLTGESYKHTPVSYLKEAALIASEYFQGIALEVHPMETAEYKELFAAGVDGIAVYQETYDRARYAQVHLSGYKKDYDFRYATPRRAAEAGMRQISLGILLGLSDPCTRSFCPLPAFKGIGKIFSWCRIQRVFPKASYRQNRNARKRERRRCAIC